MEMIAHSPKMAKKAGVPQAVGKEFAAADKGKKFKQGGEMAKKSDLKKLFKGKDTKSEELKEAKAIKSGKITPEEYAKGEKSEGIHKMKSGGSCYKDGGSVKKAPAASKSKVSSYAPASQKAALQKAVQAKAPKASDADRAAKNTAVSEKVKGMKAQMAARNTPVPKAPDADRSAKQASMMQKFQAMKGAQQAKAQAKPMQQAPTQSSQQSAIQKLQAGAGAQQAKAQASPAQPMGGMEAARQRDSAISDFSAANQHRQMGPALGGSASMGAAPMNKMKKGGVTKSKIDGVAQRGKTKCMKNGGFVRGADGCATKGKTKGRFV